MGCFNKYSRHFASSAIIQSMAILSSMRKVINMMVKGSNKIVSDIFSRFLNSKFEKSIHYSSGLATLLSFYTM